MAGIEPNGLGLFVFGAAFAVCCLGFFTVVGMFPLSARPAALAGAPAIALIVVGGLVVLFAPGLFEALPERLRDGRAGLIVLAGVQALGLAVLAKVGGLSWTNISWANLS